MVTLEEHVKSVEKARLDDSVAHSNALEDVSRILPRSEI